MPLAVYHDLKPGILGAFPTYDSINATSAAHLKYLHAVCQETLRLFPPPPFGLPRDVPEGGGTVDGFFVPGGVHAPQSPADHMLEGEDTKLTACRHLNASSRPPWLLTIMPP